MYYGVLAKGLVPALQSFDNLVKELLNKPRGQAPSNATAALAAVQVGWALAQASMPTLKACQHPRQLSVGAAWLCISATQARFNDPLWVQVDELTSYIQEVFQTLIDLRLGGPANKNRQAQKDISTRTAVFIVLVTLCAALYYPSLIRALNVSIKGNRALLLLLPEDVVSSVKVGARTRLGKGLHWPSAPSGCQSPLLLTRPSSILGLLCNYPPTGAGGYACKVDEKANGLSLTSPVEG